MEGKVNTVLTLLLSSEVLQKQMSDWQTFGKVRQNHYFSLPEISLLNHLMRDQHGKLTLSCGSLVGSIIKMTLSGGFNVVLFHAISKDCQVWRQQELLPKEESCRELFWDLPPSSLLFVPLWASPSLAALPLVCPWLGASQTVALHTPRLHTDMLRPFAWLPDRMFLSGLLNWEIVSSIQSKACSWWQGSSLLRRSFKLCDRGPSWANLLLNDLLWVLGFMFRISHSFPCCD